MLGEGRGVVSVDNQPSTSISQGLKLLGEWSPANIGSGRCKSADVIMESSSGASAGANVRGMWYVF